MRDEYNNFSLSGKINVKFINLLSGDVNHSENFAPQFRNRLRGFSLVVKQWQIEPDTSKRGVVDHYHAGHFQPIDADEGRLNASTSFQDGLTSVGLLVNLR